MHNLNSFMFFYNEMIPCHVFTLTLSDVRMEELIAIGASITANCKPCLKYHVSKAKENGAREQEIARAIEVGMMVRKGATTQMDELISAVSADTAAGEKVPASKRG